MENGGIICLGIIFVIYLFIEIDNFVQKIRRRVLFPYLDEDFDSELDLVGLPLMSRRDFSGDGGENMNSIIPHEDDPRFSDAQKKVLQLPLPTKKESNLVPKKKPPVKVEKKEVEDVEFEFKTIRARKKKVKKNATKK